MKIKEGKRKAFPQGISGATGAAFFHGPVLPFCIFIQLNPFIGITPCIVQTNDVHLLNEI
jgi:hypothetical protein